MLFNPQKNKSKPNYLEMHPFKTAEFEIVECELVNILVPRFSSKFARRYILPRMRNPYFRANLDELGSYLWLNIDGTKSVAELVDLMREKFAEKVEPAVERVLTFLTQLYNAGFINFFELTRRNDGKHTWQP
ncbi:MAG: PqqD family protein [Ignavibacteria bacterium]|nr:PqqD family protein [Ignavibacteria bacterium]